MDRLLSLLIVNVICASVAIAQPASPRFSVTGDVAAPQTYEYRPEDTVHTLDVLNSAGFGNQPGHALILRGDPPRAVAVDNIHQGMKGTGSILASGDLIVFRNSSSTPTGTPNALVLMGDTPLVLPLADGGRSLGSLLKQLQISADVAAPTIRSAAGQAHTIRLTGEQQIQHGDIVDLTSALNAYNSDDDAAEESPLVIADARPIGSGTELAFHSVSHAVDDADLANTLLPVEPTEPAAQMQLKTTDTVASDGIESGTNSTGNFLHVASLQSNEKTQLAQPPNSFAGSTPDRQATTASSPIWNLVFVVGLLFAMSLITVGWLKTAQEQENERLRAEETSRRQPAGGVTAASVNEATINEDAPILSIGVDAEEEAQSTDAQTAAAEEWYSRDWNESESVEISAEDFERLTSDADIATDESTTDAGNVAVWQDLEDLIQNRLPLELKQAELPLKVALFGKPSGPQRLRVDSAHTQIAPPHMMSAKRQSKTQRPAMATASTGPAQTARKENGQSQTNKRSPGTKAAQNTGQANASRLDRALNFLEEQAD